MHASEWVERPAGQGIRTFKTSIAQRRFDWELKMPEASRSLRLGLMIALTMTSWLCGQTAYQPNHFPPGPGLMQGDHHSLASGDFDGDGAKELVLGRSVAGSPGTIEFLSPTTGARLRTLVNPNPTSNSEPDGFARKLLVIPDQDGDSIEDLVVATPKLPIARVDLFSGASGARIWSTGSPTSNRLFGWGLDLAPDQNGDGRPEILVGAPSACSVETDGCIFPQFATPGRAYVLSGLNGNILTEWESALSPASSFSFGMELCSTPDLDGDNVADIIVASNPSIPTAQVQAFSGSSGAFLGLMLSISAFNARLTFRVVSDLNSDGTQDIVVSYRGLNGLGFVALSGNGSGQLWGNSNDSAGGPVLPVGDMNADGVIDLVVARGANAGNNLQSMKLISGADGGQIWGSLNSTSLARTTGLALVGDLNSDGIADIASLNQFEGDSGSIQTHSTTNGQRISYFDGDSGRDSFGASLARTSDFDGDSIDDILIGAPHRNANGFYDAGTAFVVSSVTGAVLKTLTSPRRAGLFGYSVLNPGDLNGDQIPDFVVGSPAADLVLPGIPIQGYADAISGADSTVLWTVNSQTIGGHLGTSMTTLADLSGDGVAEIAIGVPLGLAGALPGRVLIINGRTGAIQSTLQPSILPDRFGTTVETIGDVNGDSIPDLAVGSPAGLMNFSVQSNASALTNGQVFLNNSAPGFVRVFSGSSLAPLYTVNGPQPGSAFGFSIARLGDVNADGISDFAACAPRATPNNITGAGQILVVSGASGQVIRTHSGLALNDMLGYSLETVGDIDSDGISDYAATSPLTPGLNAQGIVLPRTVVRVYSGATGTILWRSLAPLADAQFLGGSAYGYSLANLGDLNNDGRAELAIGVPASTDNLGLPKRGRVDVVSPIATSGVTPFGTACAMTIGSQTFLPTLSTTGGPPTILVGNTAFAATLAGAPPNAPMILVFGTSATSWLGNLLPAELGPVGLPGCYLSIAPELLFPATTSSTGSATLPLPIPAQPIYSGLDVFLQAYVQSPALPFAAQTTQALRITLQ